MSTRTFLYRHAPVRMRVCGGEPVWFIRDVAAALGLRLPTAPLLPESAVSLPGIATAEQVQMFVHRAGWGAEDSFRAWMADVSARLVAQPSSPGPAPRPRHLTPVPIRRTRAA
ncbi:hypothetical protein [Streptomyces microflavus]|uniref:hypothetical protein n=1 Tax=Streptomyces microflavus TaxID=1919 RepID=UPI0036687427